MLIKEYHNKNTSIYILHSGIEIFCKNTGFKHLFVGYSLAEAKRKFKEILKNN